MDVSFKNGLVEVNFPANDLNVWYDAYLLDIKPECIEEISANNDEEKIDIKNNRNLIALIVMAIKDEPASITITKRLHHYELPMNQIRFKPKLMPLKFEVNNNIEVMVVEDDKKFIAWKLAKIKKIKNTNAVVEYIDHNKKIIDSNFDEEFSIISWEHSRTMNPFKPLNDAKIDGNPFARTELSVPDYLQRGDTSWLCNTDFHEQFKQNVKNLINIYFDIEKKLLICLGYVPDRSEYSKEKFINQCHLLSEFHFRSLKEKHWLCKRFLTPVINQNPNEWTIHLPIAKHLLGLSIGKQGANIQNARNLDDILSIELHEYMSTLIIKGKNEEACQKASNMLNFVEEYIEIDYENRIFFDRNMMQELTQKTNIVKFQWINPMIKDNNDNDDKRINRLNINDKKITLKIIGNRESVDNFKLLFNYQLTERIEMNKLRQKFQNLVGVDDTSSYNHRRKRFSDVVKKGN